MSFLSKSLVGVAALSSAVCMPASAFAATPVSAAAAPALRASAGLQAAGAPERPA
eukprot:CAMPEP_0197897808 /NCGR_PEP_ID=MMETSP1439-20131203/42453_1 /TAXON_ID=66791 /ORGANISM="Gonyaulax spinifera, Strain CCMP409" /LENGTH=54 /DNA_ID=CAMNT_0043518461 /DNA_START=100 /DNA_END=260 /DNA_ORIENTATION=+